MPVIEIRRNSDGVVRSYFDSYEWQGDYMWTDGNYSCDCNRYLFFMRAAGEDEGDLIADRCGDGGYSVRITDARGNVLYEDDDWAQRS
jgi:hypothetical protein